MCPGLHHAKKSAASGFCYVNDIVLGILELLKVIALDSTPNSHCARESSVRGATSDGGWEGERKKGSANRQEWTCKETLFASSKMSSENSEGHHTHWTEPESGAGHHSEWTRELRDPSVLTCRCVMTSGYGEEKLRACVLSLVGLGAGALPRAVCGHRHPPWRWGRGGVLYYRPRVHRCDSRSESKR
eukprot:2125943-Rhodomonas_salina.2